MKFLRFLDKRILWTGVIVVLILLMMDFNNRMSELLRLEAEKDTVTTQVNALVQTEQTLRTQIAFATSDLAVEKWAREQGRMAREGDYPIIPLPPPGYTPEPELIVAPTPKPIQNWEVWMALFLGE
jgi:cell division protein FtsB